MTRIAQPADEPGVGADPGFDRASTDRHAQSIRVGLVEDHHLVREGVRLVLSAVPGLEVVGEAADGAEAFALVEAMAPDVLLVDVTLPDADGIQLLRAVRTRFPRVALIALTMHRDAETVRQALNAGAAGYVVKGARASELVDAIRAVAHGDRYLHSTVTGAVVEDSLRWLHAGSPLSVREREILGLLAGGSSPAEIGHLLGISPHTVRRHIANLAAKIEVRGIAGLVAYARAHDLAREPG